MNNVIAHTSIFGQRPGEGRFELLIEIGVPYQCSDDPKEWACPAAVRPLFKRLHDAHGGDSLQSLRLAISLAQDLPQDFIEKGGSLSYEAAIIFLLSPIRSESQRGSKIEPNLRLYILLVAKQSQFKLEIVKSS